MPCVAKKFQELQSPSAVVTQLAQVCGCSVGFDRCPVSTVAGIPIAQQHLVWQEEELEDDFCLHDYDIQDGATLRLVLAMRGGPINTRRGKFNIILTKTNVSRVHKTARPFIAQLKPRFRFPRAVTLEDPALREVTDYMESNRDELLEQLPSGRQRQVTLLVYREGDQLNFYRVVERGDGTLSPLSESLRSVRVPGLPVSYFWSNVLVLCHQFSATCFARIFLSAIAVTRSTTCTRRRKKRRRAAPEVTSASRKTCA